MSDDAPVTEYTFSDGFLAMERAAKRRWLTETQVGQAHMEESGFDDVDDVIDEDDRMHDMLASMMAKHSEPEPLVIPVEIAEQLTLKLIAAFPHDARFLARNATRIAFFFGEHPEDVGMEAIALVERTYKGIPSLASVIEALQHCRSWKDEQPQAQQG